MADNSQILEYVRSQWPGASDIPDDTLLQYTQEHAPQLFTGEDQTAKLDLVKPAGTKDASSASSLVSSAESGSGKSGGGGSSKASKASALMSLFGSGDGLSTSGGGTASGSLHFTRGYE